MTSRQLFDIQLQPVSGSRFQPTGFPDIGTALFKRPVTVDGVTTWQDAVMIESAQSMANRLEGAAWDAGADSPNPVLAGLPYVRVVDTNDNYLTSSRTEAHRLASAFVKDATFGDQDMRVVIKERLGLQDNRPLSYRDIAEAVFKLDPMCLIHGVFFAEAASVWPGQPKILRAVTATIEAYDVHRADSGGVKRDHVMHSLGDKEKTGGTAEGYGTVPFHRTEWTAAEILAMFSIDLAQLDSYGLPGPATALLLAIARWEIRSLLDAGLRLRTACDLEPCSAVLVDRAGDQLPSGSDLATTIEELTAQCGDLLGAGAPMEVVWAPGAKGKRAS